MKKQNIWIIIGLVLLVLLYFKTPFLASVVRTCQNSELDTLNKTTVYLAANNYTIVPIAQLAVGNKTFDAYDVTITGVGTYTLSETTPYDCDDVVNELYINTSTRTELNGRNILIQDSKYYWCNGNLLLSITDISILSKYVAHFETCLQVVGPDYVMDTTYCTASGGLMHADGFCYCNSSLLELNKVCPAPVNQTVTPTPPALTTTTTTPTPTIGMTPPTPVDKWPKLIFYISAVLAILFLAYYYLFEKGDNRGFIRKRGRR